MASEAGPSHLGTDDSPQFDDGPPSYNDATGTLDTRNGGVNTQTRIGDDGRVEIDIKETEEALARQIQQLQLAAKQESFAATEGPPTPTPTYAPSYLDSNKTDLPPPLNIVIHVVGSRGDVQPFVALGLELKNKYGHRVRLATHGTFKKFVEENGLEFFDIGGDPAELMAFMVKNPGLIPGIKSLKAGDVGKRRKGMAEIMQGCWKSCADSDEAKRDENGPRLTKPFIANAIIANPPSFAHIHCAEKLGIPLHLMFTMPWSPTTDFPHPIANIKSSNASGGKTNEMSYTLVDMMTWQGLGDIVNKFRSETLNLVELTQAAAITMFHRLRVPYTYCWSPALIPKPKDWGPHISISGFYFLSLASNYQPEPALAEFLAAGPPPVYIGFGSIVVDDPNAMTEMIFEAVSKTGQRALVSKGWGGLGGDELSTPDGVFMLGNCPHDWLFKHVSCVVHHGGAGTTAAGIALGKDVWEAKHPLFQTKPSEKIFVTETFESRCQCRPTVIVPFFGDQPFWGAMIERAGAGPTPIPYSSLTAEGLANAILYALKPETLDRAKELGDKIREERGCETGAASFHSQMNISRLRCMMAPSRVAVWRVKTNGPNTEDIRLSAFAATVLGNKGLLDVNQLKLYRPCEYYVSEDIVVSNFNSPNPVLTSLGSFAIDVLMFPVYKVKATAGIVYEPVKGARKDGWKGFGKGLGKGVANLFFLKRGVFTVHGQSYGIRAAYEAIKKKMGSGTLTFILAAHFTNGFEEVQKSTEEERQDVVRRWQDMAPDLKLKQSRSSAASSITLTSITSSTGTASSSTASEPRKNTATETTSSTS